MNAIAQEQLHLFAQNLICVCIDKEQNGDVEGRLLQPFDHAYGYYKGAADMILQMNRLYDLWNYPQTSLRMRTFASEQPKRQKMDIRKYSIHARVEEMQEERGKEGTFIVQVQYRQNATWQGQVIWAEENRKEHFRSALELIKLIDSAMDEQRSGSENAAHGHKSQESVS